MCLVAGTLLYSCAVSSFQKPHPSGFIARTDRGEEMKRSIFLSLIGLVLFFGKRFQLTRPGEAS